jgi:hypothetical protein
MDLARAPCRAPLTARKMGSGYENDIMLHRNILSQDSLPVPSKPAKVTNNEVHVNIDNILSFQHFILFSTKEMSHKCSWLESLEIARRRFWKFNSKYIESIKTAPDISAARYKLSTLAKVVCQFKLSWHKSRYKETLENHHYLKSILKSYLPKLFIYKVF